MEVNSSIKNRFMNWLKNISQLIEIKIPRCVAHLKVKQLNIHFAMQANYPMLW